MVLQADTCSCAFKHLSPSPTVFQGSAVGKGQSNGTYKGQRLFSCPDFCALFVPASHIRPRQWSSSSDGHQRARDREHQRSSNGHHSSNGRLNNHLQPQQGRHISFRQHHPNKSPQLSPFSVLSRTTEPAPVTAHTQIQGPGSPPPFRVGQRVGCHVDDRVCAGEVGYCGPLPGQGSSGLYVGAILVSTTNERETSFCLIV